MDIEIIKKVELLVSLKGTEDGKQQVWLVGTVFDRDVKPFPTSIIAEIKLNRIRPTFKVLETDIKSKKKAVAVDQDVSSVITDLNVRVEDVPPPIVEKSEVPKDDSSKPKTRRRRR
jgi:hypothetical protein